MKTVLETKRAVSHTTRSAESTSGPVLLRRLLAACVASMHDMNISCKIVLGVCEHQRSIRRTRVPMSQPLCNAVVRE